MEFVKIIIKNKTTGTEIPAGVPVFINGELNGKTGSRLKLDAGKIDIRVEYSGTPASTIIDLKDTTATAPMVVTINTTEEPPKKEKTKK